MLSPRIILLGYHGHGKRTACRYLQRNYNLTSSLAHIQYSHIVFPELRKIYGYKTEFDCFVDRENHALEWLRLIELYNRSYPARTGRMFWKQSNIYSGLIDINEYRVLKARKMFDMSIWIDARPRVSDSDGITVLPGDVDEVIPNDVRIDMERRLDSIMTRLSVKETPSPSW